jgi:hypothetical protein
MGMRNLIAALMAILGTLLIIAGAGIIIMPALAQRTLAQRTLAQRTLAERTLAERTGTPAGSGAELSTEADGGSVLDRSARRLSRLGPSDRLIVWGIVLLVVSAIAAGAIGFSLNATATGK